jgi:hypothetical protein
MDPPISRLERPLRRDLTHSPLRPDMTAICAKETAGVDVNRPLQIAAVDAAVTQ